VLTEVDLKMIPIAIVMKSKLKVETISSPEGEALEGRANWTWSWTRIGTWSWGWRL